MHKLPTVRQPRQTEGNVIGDDLSPVQHCDTSFRPFAIDWRFDDRIPPFTQRLADTAGEGEV